MRPTLDGFLSFIRTVMGIDTDVLPDDAAVIPMALGVALAIVNTNLICVPPGPMVAGVPPVSIYTLAVYNLGASNIINYAQDVDGETYFSDLRTKWNVYGFVSGVISASNDENTGNSMVVQEAAKNFTLANLQQLKDPYGRQYLAFAQSAGPQVVGIT